MASQWCKLFFYIVIVTCTSFGQALEVSVLNDVSEMISTKKIMLRIDFSSREKFLYRDMLRFSSSNPKIILRYWKASAATKPEYISSFHQKKRVFADPFDLEITFETSDSKENSLLSELTNTNIVISYVSLNTQLAHDAKTTVIPITKSEIFSPTLKNLDFSNKLTATKHPEIINFKGSAFCDEEISYLYQIEDFYYQLGDLANRINQSTEAIFIIGLLVLILFFGIWKTLRKQCSFLEKYYPYQLTKIIILLAPIILAYGIKAFGAAGISYLIIGIYVLIIGSYLLVKQDHEQKNVKSQSLLILANIFCIIALPLIIKGILLILE